MKIVNALTANIEAVLTRTAMVALVAGAAFMATPAKANAQVSFGVRVGPVVGGYGYVRPRPIYVEPRPVYVPPVYGAPVYGYYGARPGYDRHDAWVRHEELDRRHDWDRRDYR